VCATNSVCDAPEAVSWSIKVKMCAALPSRHNGMSRCSDVRRLLINPVRISGWDMGLVTHSTIQECVVLHSAAFPARHLGYDGRQDARRIPKVPLRPSRILHLFLRACRVIKGCTAFHASDAFLKCHLDRNGFLKFVSDAFHVPVTRLPSFRLSNPETSSRMAF
jgi:hypothetical protein